MRISFIILNYITWQDTLKEVYLLHDNTKIKFADIIVIDNASPNESANKLLRLLVEMVFLFIASENNGGYAAGNNIGLRMAYNLGYDIGWIFHIEKRKNGC